MSKSTKTFVLGFAVGVVAYHFYSATQVVER